ncbi:MAG TPA: tetratricopeptide repeat protein, partial [Polyangiaceae bacterium]|nr:tetratricopeptide repeat protein [Polyangiaceae bacterium]
MMRRPSLGSAAVVALALALHAGSAFALDSGAARSQAETAIQHIETEVVRGTATGGRITVPQATPAERVAAGDMLLRTKDYDRAVAELSKVLELHRQGKVPEAAYADATFMIGEAYFQSRQYLSARRHFREIVDQGNKGIFEGYAGRAVSRLVDVALRTGDIESLDYVFARLDRLPASDRSGSLAYARAKALFAKKDFAAARQAVNLVPAGSDYALQSQYLLGVVLVREAAPVIPPSAPTVATPGAVAKPTPGQPPRFAAAIEQFRKVTRMPAPTDAQKHVVDLAWMAIGRLFHENDAYLDAAEAYSHIDRASPEFATMLYELAWVYVRLGDFMRAQRALEVLAILDPRNIEAADGSLLRADLMLRSGQFDKALALYKSVQGKFDPVREQVDRFLQSTNDPAVYYDKLTADQTISGDEKLPAIVIDWAREQAEDEHVFGMIEDVNRSRELIRNGRKLAARLNAVLNGPTRVRALPEIQAKLQQALTLLNRTSKARRTLAEGLDDVSPDASGELASVRRERRDLMKRMGWLPVADVDFA